jgi:DNA segregation ATPase FtsK/SpoIIIE, S-DNA-T family
VTGVSVTWTDVVAAWQDPRKEVLGIRNLFPDRIAMRLDEPEQVDMVLGGKTHERGAACELIPTDPATGAGVAFVRLESGPDPVRVRAGWVSDADIRAMAAQVTGPEEPTLAIAAGAGVAA